jgi:hypothetical protein
LNDGVFAVYFDGEHQDAKQELLRKGVLLADC